MICLPPQSTRRLAILLLCVLALQITCASAALAQDGSPAVAAEEDSFLSQLFRNLFNSRGLMQLFGRPEFTIAAFIAINAIVFIETGLLFPILPGDSLLVTAGVVCYASGWNLPLLLITLCISAIVGDSVGYAIGYKSGPKLFSRPDSWLFHKDYLLKAQAFYEKHGGKTIILARFMPIIRTFAPVVAGVGRMEYRKFLFFNIFGGVGWVVSMVLVGYFMTRAINPTFQPIFGPTFDVQDHIEKVIILIVFLSIAPGIYVWLRGKLKPKTSQSELVSATSQK